MTTGCTSWINIVKDSGADPTGVTDATTILNSALSSCPAGGVVYVPGGATLKISGTITIPGDVTLKGDDASDPAYGSILSVANGSNLAAVISDGTWASNGASVSNAPRVEGIVIKGNGPTRLPERALASPSALTGARFSVAGLTTPAGTASALPT